MILPPRQTFDERIIFCGRRSCRIRTAQEYRSRGRVPSSRSPPHIASLRQPLCLRFALSADKAKKFDCTARIASVVVAAESAGSDLNTELIGSV
jgi:hypothetical protein